MESNNFKTGRDINGDPSEIYSFHRETGSNALCDLRENPS